MADADPLAAPYPGPGFFPISYFELGNGDVHGLYWPIGRESQPPIVCEMYHDEGKLEPHSGSLHGLLAHVRTQHDWEADEDDFTEWLELCETAGFGEESAASYDDVRSPARLYARAREALAAREVETATVYLERALDVLPEYGEAAAMLAAQYRRVGRLVDAVRLAIQSFTSPPMFGGGTLAPWVAKLGPAAVPEMKDDPVFVRRARISKMPNGQKENDTYAVMDECVAAYLSYGDGPAAARLRLSWAQHLERETYSFRERFGWHDDARRMALVAEELERAGLGGRLGAFAWRP